MSFKDRFYEKKLKKHDAETSHKLPDLFKKLKQDGTSKKPLAAQLQQACYAEYAEFRKMKASGWKFGWKRKLGENVSKEASNTFENEAKDENSELLNNGEIDWLTLAPLRKNIRLEDALGKSLRLKNEGSVLADSERYWEAIKKWDEALHLTPNDETLYEMKAQVLLLLCEVYPAVHMAQKAVQLKPNWWVGLQTLGRAQLGLGEVLLAVKSFSRACLLNPEIEELWEEDLNWARTLLQKKQKAIEEQQQAEDRTKLTITEIDDVDENKDCDSGNNSNSASNSSNSALEIYKSAYRTSEVLKDSNDNLGSTRVLRKLPKNYVLMRNT